MSRRTLVVAIVAARIVYAQAFPPPAGIRGGDGADLLEQAREKVLSATRRLPKYTCLETINRAYYVVPPRELRRRAMTETPADACIADRPGHFSLEARDRLRVEVAEGVGLGEIHSWPGASRFETRTFGEMFPFWAGQYWIVRSVFIGHLRECRRADQVHWHQGLRGAKRVGILIAGNA
jgi:hypothetical protein